MQLEALAREVGYGSRGQYWRLRSSWRKATGMRLAPRRRRNASDSTEVSTYRSCVARAPRMRRNVRTERTYVLRQRP
jgi:hypothetical protein